MIALMGLDAETGVFMLLFLDLSYNERVRKGKMRTHEDLREAIIHGAVKRVRPKAMTVACAMMGLLPIMWSMGTGADVMKRIAAPMIAGLVTCFLMELLVYPAIYLLWRERSLTDAVAGDDRAALPWWRRPALVSGVSGIVVALAIAAYAFFPHAIARPLFPEYESVRQSLLSGSLEAAKASAARFASDAAAAKHPEIAKQADAVAKSTDIEKARGAFANLSDAMIAYRRSSTEGSKPQIVYCSMAKRSWLQPVGEITNPYYADPAMRSCGEVKSE